MNERSFFIGTLARRSGLTPDAIRYYEEIGVMPQPERTRSGYRVYTAADAERLAFVGRAQALGLTLEEIREILVLIDGGIEPCDHVRDRLRQRLEAVERRMAELTSLRETLLRTLQEAERTEGPGSCRCRIIEGAGGERGVQIAVPAIEPPHPPGERGGGRIRGESSSTGRTR